MSWCFRRTAGRCGCAHTYICFFKLSPCLGYYRTLSNPNPMSHSTPGLPVHHQLPESTQTHGHRVGDVIQLCHSLLPLLLPPSIFLSIRVFSNESALCIRWSKYWSFSFNISPSNEHSGLIFFSIDWLDLLGVQGTLKSLLQHHSSKASILWRSAFFIVQLSHPYMTTGKTIALTRWTFQKLEALILIHIQLSLFTNSVSTYPTNCKWKIFFKTPDEFSGLAQATIYITFILY